MAAANSTTPLRVAIYARVSTKDKRQEVENQLRQIGKGTAQRAVAGLPKIV